MSKPSISTRTGIALLFLLTLFASDLLARDADLEAKRIYDSIRDDTRSPSHTDISGSWTINPEVRGPSHHFTLEQEKSSISGEGFFTGCMLTYSYTLTGAVSDGLVSLTIHREGKEDKKTTFRIVEYRVVVALEKTDYDDKYPMVSYKDRKEIESVLFPERNNEPNQSAHTTPASAPR